MQKNIIFHENKLSERGTSIAIYDYAYYIREYLNLNPIIVYNNNNDNNLDVIIKFKKEFNTIFYNNFAVINKFVDIHNIDYFYAIKFGIKDDILVDGCKNLIHSVFCTDISQIHGDKYAVISEWMSLKSNNQIPYVNHMINLPNHNIDFRYELNIPNNAVVIGRYGSYDTFNISFVFNSIRNVLNTRSDIYFLFANTPCNIKNNNCYYFDIITDLYNKTKFINTCDAFLHARDYGETFGLSVAEFAIKNKQIISYDNEELQNSHPLGGRNHFLYLKDNCFKYKNEKDLDYILNNISKTNPFNTEYLKEMFSPKNTIKQFNQIFLS